MYLHRKAVGQIWPLSHSVSTFALHSTYFHSTLPGTLCLLILLFLISLVSLTLAYPRTESFSFFMYNQFLGDFIQCHDFKYFIYINGSQIYISIPDHFLSYRCYIQCLTNISTWTPNRPFNTRPILNSSSSHT